MKKPVLVVPVIVLGIFIMTVCLNKIRLRYGWSDAIWRTVMMPFTGTRWADGFSEKKFSKVRIGMSSLEVKALLGDPLKEWCGQNRCAWFYSWQDTPTADFDQRSISFDSSWRVNGLRHDFYID